MIIHSFICTRDKKLRDITKDLILFYEACGIYVKLIIGSDSIFKGYKTALEELNPEDKEIIILCHDDIEIYMSPKSFVRTLVSNMDTGFLGVAGATKLSSDAIWWNKNNWNEGKLCGCVYHGKITPFAQITYYGPCIVRPVVAMDGLFMAATKKCLSLVGLEKPKYFEGEWDFYDIHYSTKAYKLGLKNIIAPIPIRHESNGELVGRDSWHKNRKAFIENTPLPIVYDENYIRSIK